MIGDRIRLHPVWLLFALVVCGHFLGFTGVLLAIPVAAVAGVMIRFVLGRYRQSPFFQAPAGAGRHPQEP